MENGAHDIATAVATTTPATHQQIRSLDELSTIHCVFLDFPRIFCSLFLACESTCFLLVNINKSALYRRWARNFRFAWNVRRENGWRLVKSWSQFDRSANDYVRSNLDADMDILQNALNTKLIQFHGTHIAVDAKTWQTICCGDGILHSAHNQNKLLIRIPSAYFASLSATHLIDFHLDIF